MKHPNALTLSVPATAANFDEAGYLAANPDVAAAVRSAQWPSGRAHFNQIGHSESRRQNVAAQIEGLQREKIARVEPLLRRELPHRRRGLKYDFLTDALRRETGIVATDAVSQHDYDPHALDLINRCADGLVVDCGPGSRPAYFSNVINFEIVDYLSTDILGVGEELPFQDGSFDAVISLAVLEHVRDPFRCAAEISRVLKPGGKLLCCVPFLQPLHGYPHHYYNMTGQGLRALFERHLKIDDHQVVGSGLPIWALTWIASSWANGLDARAREQFLSTPIRELLQPAEQLYPAPWVRNLSSEKNFELAASTLLFASKR